jgi:hypothetical protein
MSLDTERFDAEATELNELGRLELADELETILRAKATFMQDVEIALSSVRAAGSRYFNRWDRAKRMECLTIEEVMSDFRANAEASFDDMIDADELRRVSALVDGGSDD